MPWHQVIGFVAAVIPLALIPGTSFALVTQKVIAGSRRDGVFVAVGTVCGLMVHATLAVVGLAALIMASSRALMVVRVLGAVYLVWLGFTTWRSTGPRSGAAPKTQARWRTPWAGSGSFGQGMWSNVFNPKASSVYLTIVPQFVTPTRSVPLQIAVLAAAHVVVVLTWLLLLTIIVSSARRIMDIPWVRLSLNRVTGAVLVGLGIKTAAA